MPQNPERPDSPLRDTLAVTSLGSRITLLILILYALLTAYTVFSLILGYAPNPMMTPITSLTAFSFALLHGGQRLGWKQASLLLGCTFAVSLAFESIGVATGLVYGPYHYTDKLGFKFLGLVPLLIPVAWFMMSYPSLMIASRIVPKTQGFWTWRLSLAALGAMIMTAWDLAMDPMMVYGEHWVWEGKGAYFGVPLQNYWGWWLTIFVAFLLFLILGQSKPAQVGTYNQNFERQAVLSYTVSGLSTIVVDFHIGLGGAALAGLFAMLPWVVIGWLRHAEPLTRNLQRRRYPYS